MSEQTTTNASCEPVLCKMACGFFGNSATGGCCSQCWIKQNKAKAAAATAPSSPTPTVSSPTPPAAKEETTPEPMDVEIETPAPIVAPKKIKKKKASYKSLMAGMMQASGDRDTEKEKEALRQGLGGGSFTKITKI